ncbi:MFS transporter [Streptomyces zagrosensis]|uniref:MFS family permease n=1 Tax=Streptomyces zagrosensis TaxID=1042984 RepID=A0A7W9V2U1_9ACTN|nr:MFS transporter [Streptomyces zagrosensis]MBB5939631.1 MFS family permease [Streptomyces zagrosensis]
MAYRELATRPVLSWVLVAVAARMPVAMAPLALVFLVRERPGGYTLGAVLAAAYVIGEVVGAATLGARLRADQARRQLAIGLAVGAAAFAALGLASTAHPAVLGALAVLAGAAPGAAPGGLRALLTSLIPERLSTQALSMESMSTYGVWTASPALATSLALGVDPALPLLLGALLAAAAVAGLWALPAGWEADESDREGASMLRILAAAWPVYVTGAAALSLLALAELVLPALLEQRGIAVGWAGPLLAGYSIAAAIGAFVYGLRSWPGRLATQSLVLMLAVMACVAAAAVVPGLGLIAVALLVAGLLQSGVQMTRTLALREALPASALAAAYSVMYAAVGVGYAVSATLSGVVQEATSPATAILGGVVFALLLTLVAAVGDRRSGAKRRPVARPGHTVAGARPQAAAVEATPTAAPATDATPAPTPAVGTDPVLAADRRIDGTGATERP